MHADFDIHFKRNTMEKSSNVLCHKEVRQDRTFDNRGTKNSAKIIDEEMSGQICGKKFILGILLTNNTTRKEN